MEAPYDLLGLLLPKLKSCSRFSGNSGFNAKAVVHVSSFRRTPFSFETRRKKRVFVWKFASECLYTVSSNSMLRGMISAPGHELRDQPHPDHDVVKMFESILHADPVLPMTHL